MKNPIRSCCFCCSILCLLLFSSCMSKEPVSKSGFYLNTFITITLYDSSEEALLDGCMEICEKYEQIFSRTREDSELYLLNSGSRNDENGYAQVSDELYELISLGIEYGALSQGALDITIAPVSSLWDFSSAEGEASVPSKEAIELSLALVDYRKVELLTGNRVYLPEGMALDLGAVAKGYIADRIKEYLLEQGVGSAVINLGGNVLCIGSKSESEPFQIGVQKPFQDQNETVAVLKLSDASVVTSGIYERCFTAEDGTFYHHILNPDTGYPCENELVSVTIVAESSAQADALSTACFCMGLEEGMELLDSLPQVYGLFITEDGELHDSAGFTEAIEMIKR